MPFWIDSIILSYTQVLFCAKKWLGWLLILATFVNIEIGFAGLLGVILSNVGAYLAGFNKTQIKSGLYGLNGLLVGLAIVFYYGINHSFLILLLIGCVLCLLVTAALNGFFTYHLNLPILSLPFVIVTIILYLASENYTGLNLSPKLIDISGFLFSMGLPQIIEIYLKSLGAIFFQINMLSGLIIFLGLLLYSRIATFLSILGFACGICFYKTVGGEQGDIIYGMVGFNFILTSIALGGALTIPGISSYITALLASIVSALFCGAVKTILGPYDIPVLALPFNLTVLLVIYSLKFRPEYAAKPKLVDFIPGSPEENLYYYITRIKRISSSKLNLPFYGRWVVSQGVNGEITHKDKWAYAWDFVVIGEDGMPYKGEGENLTDFLAYKLPVIAPGYGKVVKIENTCLDNSIGKMNLEQNWGNYVIIYHDFGFYSKVSHLAHKSINVKEGDIVNRGALLGLCGNSGRSPEPHIHFQLQAYPDIGSPTIVGCFGNCIKVEQDKEEILTSYVPREKEMVKNIEITEDIKKALEFPLGKEYHFRVKIGTKEFDERWIIEADVYGNPYIHSSIKDSKVFFTNDGQIMMLLDFIGSKKTALYGLFLGLSKIPLYYNSNLGWNDTLPATYFVTGLKKCMVDMITPFIEFTKIHSHLKYDKVDNYFVVNAEIGSDDSPIYQTRIFLNDEAGPVKIILKEKEHIKLEAWAR